MDPTAAQLAFLGEIDDRYARAYAGALVFAFAAAVAVVVGARLTGVGWLASAVGGAAAWIASLAGWRAGPVRWTSRKLVLRLSDWMRQESVSDALVSVWVRSQPGLTFLAAVIDRDGLASRGGTASHSVLPRPSEAGGDLTGRDEGKARR